MSSDCGYDSDDSLATELNEIPPTPQISSLERAVKAVGSLFEAAGMSFAHGQLEPTEESLRQLSAVVKVWLGPFFERHPLTFTTPESFVHMTARFVFYFYAKEARISFPYNWNPSGCVVWRQDLVGDIKCLHGEPMITVSRKEELSEELAEGPQYHGPGARRERWRARQFEKNLVVLRWFNAVICQHDLSGIDGAHSGYSCGWRFNDGRQVQEAFRQLHAYQLAAYRSTALECRCILPLKCYCNWAADSRPMTGRQTCMVTVEHLEEAEEVLEPLLDPVAQATVDHPYILTFGCCNPTPPVGAIGPHRRCHLQISGVDLLSAYQLAQSIWQHFSDSGFRFPLPEAVWRQELAFKRRVLPYNPLRDNSPLYFAAQ
ncbi:DPB-T [Tree shrew adenovirus 1]|uniref:DPB-T n=1 Tax=Tree shrew adenovirus serotype 1 TaxID=47680 RepID=A0A2U9AG87_ADET1|nr:DPB-T [Tree shrew adenovirus 1]